MKLWSRARANTGTRGAGLTRTGTHTRPHLPCHKVQAWHTCKRTCIGGAGLACTQHWSHEHRATERHGHSRAHPLAHAQTTHRGPRLPARASKASGGFRGAQWVRVRFPSASCPTRPRRTPGTPGPTVARTNRPHRPPRRPLRVSLSARPALTARARQPATARAPLPRTTTPRRHRAAAPASWKRPVLAMGRRAEGSVGRCAPPTGAGAPGGGGARDTGARSRLFRGRDTVRGVRGEAKKNQKNPPEDQRS